MIQLSTGTPGSGKSLDCAQIICNNIQAGKPVIANFPINMDFIKNKKKNKTKSDSMFYYWDNSEITVDRLVKHAHEYHKVGKESQSLLIIDEAAVMFNVREWNTKNNERMKWITFFQQHRKLGFDVILVAQNDRMIDKQIRGFVEYEVKHRKVNNFMKFGLGTMFDKMNIKAFMAVTYWYGIKSRLEARMFFYNPKYARLYDTMQVFSNEAPRTVQTVATAAAAPAVPAGGGVGVPSPKAPPPQGRLLTRTDKTKLRQAEKNTVVGHAGCRGRSYVYASR